jgi:hypothetical protein
MPAPSKRPRRESRYTKPISERPKRLRGLPLNTTSSPKFKREPTNASQHSRRPSAALPTPSIRTNTGAHTTRSPICSIRHRKPPLEATLRRSSEEPEDFVKADAASRGSAHAQMLELARTHNAANPKLSPEQSYAAVYTDRASVGLKNRMSDESWSLQNVGDVRYAEQMRAPHTNPHRGGSGKRPSAKSLDEQVPRARFDMLPDPTVGAVRASPGRN